MQCWIQIRNSLNNARLQRRELTAALGVRLVFYAASSTVCRNRPKSDIYWDTATRYFELKVTIPTGEIHCRSHGTLCMYSVQPFRQIWSAIVRVYLYILLGCICDRIFCHLCNTLFRLVPDCVRQVRVSLVPNLHVGNSPPRTPQWLGWPSSLRGTLRGEKKECSLTRIFHCMCCYMHLYIYVYVKLVLASYQILSQTTFEFSFRPKTLLVLPGSRIVTETRYLAWRWVPRYGSSSYRLYTR